MTNQKTRSLAELVSASDLIEDLQSYMYARQNRIDPRGLSDVHQEANARRDDLCELLNEKLDTQGQQVLRDLCDTYTTRAVVDVELYYRRGFSDGMMTILQSVMLTA